MLPNQSTFPKFVPDQLLTSEHLNNLFNYLEEQDRISRTNLIGIGIVCGLEVQSNGTSVTIGKGVGITSSGYLVSVPKKSYTHFKAFDAVKERIYDRFVNGSGVQRFPLNELKEAAVEEGTTPITAAFLANKVVLIFVEILEEGAKNCNPNSCDDKGINVTINFRPLLIDKGDADKLQSITNGQVGINQAYLELPEVKMRRFDVVATNLQETADIFGAYRKILNGNFLKRVEETLSKSYFVLSPLVHDEYGTNPFSGLANKFAFLHNSSLNLQQLLHIQYFYDLFSDFLQAYEEMRQTGLKMLSLCNPDEQLFPRHLLLGLAVNDGKVIGQPYRQYFIPSPLFQCHYNLIHQLRWLFRRLVLMMEKFNIPFPEFNNFIRKSGDVAIRVTPSKLGDISFSEKSIPYYFKVTDGSKKLYEHWNAERFFTNSSDKNLGYHAALYNTTDEYVFSPLEFDLEPYNFFRIEGHIGKPYTHVIKTLQSIKNRYRLPFEVIALSADIRNIRVQLAALMKGNTSLSTLQRLLANKEPDQCHFQDLEALYNSLSSSLICTLCGELKYFYGLQSTLKHPDPVSFVPKVPLLVRCDPGFQFSLNTIGHDFEVYYGSIKKQIYSGPDFWLSNFRTANRLVNVNIDFRFILMYYIVQLSEAIPDALFNLDINEFSRRYNDMVRVAEFIKEQLQKPSDTGANISSNAEDLIDHLDVLIYACKKSAFESLVKDYISRWINVLLLQRFGYFVKMHPGIQHKAGVTTGGTFIVVYHEEEIEQREINITAGLVVNNAINAIRTGGQSNFKNIFENAFGRRSFGETEFGEKSFGENIFFADDKYSYINEIQKKPAINIRGFNSSKQLEAIREILTINEKQEDVIERLISEITTGTVFADFYLPYICCSDCPPVQVIINEKEPEEKAKIEIENKEYCSNDENRFVVKVSPEGGKLSGEGGVQDADGKFVFVPGLVQLNGQLSKNTVLTYEVEGSSASVTLTVYNQPFADFIPRETENNTEIKFENTSKFAAGSQWTFPDGSTSIEANPQFDFKEPGTYKVTLRVVNGICSNEVTKDINIGRENLFIGIDTKAFCVKDANAYPITVSPSGGKVKGDGTSKDANGKFIFQPGTVNLANADRKEVVLTYSKSGQSVEVKVDVFAMPEANFQFNVSANNPMLVSFKATARFGETFTWDFGDEVKATGKELTHQYRKAGEYTVSLTVNNGPCKSEGSKTVVIKEPQVEAKCHPLPKIIDLFNEVGKDDPSRFRMFIRAFSSYNQVAGLFEQLSAIATAKVEEQVAFLHEIRFPSGSVTNNIQLTLAQALVKWLEELWRGFIAENLEFRLTALKLYRVLVQLAAYIVCIQKQDVGKAKVDMKIVFEIVQKHMTQLINLASRFNEKDKEVLKLIVKDLKAELDRLNANGEAASKPEYLKLLKRIIELISSVL